MTSFIKKHIKTIATALSAIAIVAANSSAELCFIAWFYEEEMPATLKAKID